MSTQAVLPVQEHVIGGGGVPLCHASYRLPIVVQMVDVQVVTIVGGGGLLFLPLVASVLTILHACGYRNEESEDPQSACPDSHVEQRDAELVGAVSFLLVETRRTVA